MLIAILAIPLLRKAIMERLLDMVPSFLLFHGLVIHFGFKASNLECELPISRLILWSNISKIYERLILWYLSNTHNKFDLWCHLPSLFTHSRL